MKKLTLAIAVILVLVTGLLLTGCYWEDRSHEDGEKVTMHYGLAGFTEIEIGDAFQLDVIPSDTFSVTIEAGENLLDKLDVSVSGEKLIIRVDGWSFNFSETRKAVITMPVLEGLDLSGASRTVANGFYSSEDFDLEVSGASNLAMDMKTGNCEMNISGASRVTGSLVAGDIDMEVSGASNINLDGSGSDIKAGVSGASRIDMDGFRVEDADVDLSGASSGSLDIYGTLDATLSGASRLTYSGEPSLGRIETSGGSSVNRR
ncbi:MAG: DUF2807 domain-containing protein [Dehalococcoidales bacterium]|nr:DUF2807 domain-containing protein [Dehalococcoidales bacterium]